MVFPLSYLFYKLTSNFPFFYAFIYLFIFHIFILLLRSKENSISSHQTFQFQFLSFLLHFYSQKSQTLHHFVLLFSKSQNLFSKIQKNTNLHKFTQNAHFTPISFPSPQFVHLESSSHITPHHYPTHHYSPPKIIQKSHKKLIFYKNSKLPFLTPHLT